MNIERFLFAALSFPTVKLYVLNFTGAEKINETYSFKFSLVTKQTDFDPFQLMNTEIVFTLLKENDMPKIYCCAPKKVSQGEVIDDVLYFSVEIVPYITMLTRQVNSRIFLDKTLPNLLDEIMSGNSFYDIGYENRLSQKYSPQEFSMQYNETNFNYLRYKLEEQGAYFFFDEAGYGIIFADSPGSHEHSQLTLPYSPHRESELEHDNSVVYYFELSHCEIPGRVIVRNYDWKDPNRILVGKCDVRENYQGMIEVIISDKSIATQEDAERIASLRAEQLQSNSYIGVGKSNAIGLHPGLVFTLKDHNRTMVNQDYMITEITHEGNQESVISLILGLPVSKTREHFFYRNSFSCIPAEIPYRPERKAVRNTIPGVINAFIDGDNPDYPVLDNFGRYRVLFPFDLSGRSGGKASCWIRRMQEQVGKDSGMTFPLLPGTEVLISFINGDPDFPVISGALSNGETGSIAGPGNKNFSGIRTQGGAQLTFDNDHNTISLANLSGSGITFGSGSMDYMQTVSHLKIDSNAVGSSEFASIFKNSVTGYCNNQMAICGDNIKFLIDIVQAVLSKLNKNYISSLTSENNKDYNAKNKNDKTAFEIKTASILLQTFLSSYLTMKSSSVYNIQLSADKNFASSALQCFPPTLFSVGTVIASLIPHLISKISEIKDPSNNKEQEKIDSPETRYKKQAARRKVITTAISSLLPELAAIILIFVREHYIDKSNVGGIFINAADKNINLHAKTYIGQHAERGIYLNTVESEITPKAKGKPKVDKCSSWGSPRIMNKADESVDPNILAVFDKIKNENLYGQKSTVLELITQGHINKRKSEKKFKVVNNSRGCGIETPGGHNTTFIAAKTHLHYTESNYEFHTSANMYKLNSPFITLHTETDKKITDISCVKGDMFINISGMLSLFAGEIKEESKKGNILIFSQNDIMLGNSLSQNKFTHGLRIKKNEIQLLKDSQSSLDKSPKIVLSDDGVRMEFSDKSWVFLCDEYIDLHAKEIRLNGIAFQKNGQQKAKDDVIRVGNNAIQVKNVGQPQEEKQVKKIDVKVNEPEEKKEEKN